MGTGRNFPKVVNKDEYTRDNQFRSFAEYFSVVITLRLLSRIVEWTPLQESPITEDGTHPLIVVLLNPGTDYIVRYSIQGFRIRFRTNI